MSIKEFVNSLKIDDTNGEYTEKMFTVVLKDSNEFAKMYSIFDNLEDSVVDVHMTENHSICDFTLEDFDATLEADLDKDYYTLTVREAE